MILSDFECHEAKESCERGNWNQPTDCVFVVFNSRRSNESKIAIIGCKVFVAVLKLSFQNILCLWCVAGDNNTVMLE